MTGTAGARFPVGLHQHKTPLDTLKLATERRGQLILWPALSHLHVQEFRAQSTKEKKKSDSFKSKTLQLAAFVLVKASHRFTFQSSLGKKLTHLIFCNSEHLLAFPHMLLWSEHFLFLTLQIAVMDHTESGGPICW